MSCPVCGGRHYDYDDDSACLDRVINDLDQARAVAQEYYSDLRQEVSDYMWEKHYAHDPEQDDRQWLKAPEKLDGPR